MELYRDEEFCRIVSDCFSCDETFFQTVMMIHQEENGITLDEQGNFMNRKWFFVFDHGHPIILTKEHHAQIQSSGMLFARKFDTKRIRKFSICLIWIERKAFDQEKER